MPGNRAVVGGVLVALAVLGVYAATTRAGTTNMQTVVITTHDMAPGTRIQSTDVRTERVALDRSVSNHVVQSPSKIIGATMLAPLRSGDIVQSSAVAVPQSKSSHLEISFALPAARALGGDLQSGETVDVLTTNKSDATATARVAATNARILQARTAGNGSIGHTGDVTITVGLNSRAEAAAIAAAVDQGQITLVRTTGATTNE